MFSANRKYTFRFGAAVFLSLLLLLGLFSHQPRRRLPSAPLTADYVRGRGGKWIIPSSWLDTGAAPASSVVEAAEYVSELATRRQAFLNNSHIPLIIHQTWRSLDAATWSDTIRECVDSWVRMATQGGGCRLAGPEMAWLLWDDDGIEELMKKYEPDLYADFKQLPYPVEKADLFRIVVLKHFGGVYADVDTQPLKHPFHWIYDTDLTPWRDFSSTKPTLFHTPAAQSGEYSLGTVGASTQSPTAVTAVFGIEADNPPPPDNRFWRMGYTFPIQLTNWALAMSPHHPVADEFVDTFQTVIARNRGHLWGVDPLDITGPPALTGAVQAVAEKKDPEMCWDALSGNTGDPKGGRGKVVADNVLIFPITGFSPGRGWFQNMGSQGYTHRNARLRHAAAGSWRKMDLKVEYGKMCRTLFGMCREWKKIADVG